MAIQFYDVKSRQKVDIPESEVRKTKYEQQAKNGGVNTRYVGAFIPPVDERL